jgi:hypothetical protein
LLCRSCLIWWKFNLIFQFLFLFPEQWRFNSEKHYRCLYFQEFSSSSFKVSGLTLKSVIHFELIFVQGEWWGINFQSFTCGYLAFPAPFVEETVFSPTAVSGTSVKNQMTIAVWLISGSSIPFWSPRLFWAVPCCFYYNGADIIWSQVLWALLFLIRIALVSKWILGLIFLLYEEWHWKFDRDCTESVAIFTILILPIHKQLSSFHLLVSSISLFKGL